MMNTIERNLNNVNDVVTSRLDELETRLPVVPSKALAATRASVRRVNDVVESTASSVRSRFESVGDQASGAVATTSGQARAAVDRSTAAVRRGVAETTGQARAQTQRTVDAVGDEVEGALDDAKLAADPDDFATWSKSDLYARAQELDIDGRSGMTKAELVGALQKS